MGQIAVVRFPSSDSVARVVGRGAGDLEDAAHRLEALRAVRHPGVCVPDSIHLDREGDVVATLPRIQGETAGTLARIRDGLSTGECVAIGVDVADALSALHTQGLSHGDVSPSNIVVSPTRAILVDTLTGANRSERGTTGFAAPERAVGATPAGDVYSLGRVLLALVGEAGRERIRAWAEPLCAPDPATRPTAEVATRALRMCAEPVPVSVPDLGVAAAARARAGEPEEPTVRLASGKWWRIRRQAVRGVRWGAVGGAGLLGLVVVVRLLGTVWPDGPEYHYRPTIPMPAGHLATAPDSGAGSFVEARAAALEASDSEALLALTSPNSPAQESDRETARRLESGELDYDGLAVDIASVETLAVDGNRATVRVVYAVTGHGVRDGGHRMEIPATSQVLDVDLVWADGEWTAERTRPPP